MTDPCVRATGLKCYCGACVTMRKPHEMTLRDRFAVATLSGLLADPGVRLGGQDEYARKAYAMADAMLRARSR